MSAPEQDPILEAKRRASAELAGLRAHDGPSYLERLVAPARGDMKAGLTSAKVDETIIGQHAIEYESAGMGYGADKYARANYYAPPPPGVTVEKRGLEYIAAAMRHLRKVCQAVNVAMGTGGDARKAFAVIDDEPGLDKQGNITFPASGLPHIAHALASLMILVEVGVMDGLLPKDIGRPWTLDPAYAEVQRRRGRAVSEALAQKEDPDAESRRIALISSTVTASGYPTATS